MNHTYHKESTHHLQDWQIAYIARDLRHNKKITLSCLRGEADYIIEQLNSFSSPNPIITKTSNKPNSKEIYLEVAEKI